MRTPLDRNDDILATVKDLAANRGSTAGKVLSELARKALEASGPLVERNEVPLFPARHGDEPQITLDLVNRLRDAT